MKQSLPEQQDLHLWRVRPSEQEGFSRNYFTETVEGDEINVDYNFTRAMVRISVRVAAESGREYVSVIKSGTILQEREIAGRRSLDLTSRMAPYYAYFQRLNDDVLLRTIGGNYGLPTVPLMPGSLRHKSRPPLLPIHSRFSLRAWIRKHLERKRTRELRRHEMPWLLRVLGRLPAELRDISLGIGLYWAYTHSWLNLTELAGYLGVLGLMVGAWDWVWRQRDPFLPKVMLFMAAAGFAVFQQVQYRMWAIFL